MTIVPTTRAQSYDTVCEAAGMLKRFIEAVESGELMESAPQDVAVVERLQGALSALEEPSPGS
jgi:hypothetical protein